MTTHSLLLLGSYYSFSPFLEEALQALWGGAIAALFVAHLWKMRGGNSPVHSLTRLFKN
jgi:hypothetical protein